MDFDIHQLDGMTPDSEDAEAAFEAFQQALLERFSQSPEGQSRLKADPDMGFWAAQLMYYGYQYEGSVLPRMTVGDVQTVVTELFPRKISLESPEQANDTIPELVAFWKYLKREFLLPQADAVLEFLRDLEPDFPETMNDPSNFGMAKSFFSMGRDAGFDMTTEEGTRAFMAAYNKNLLARQTPPESGMPPSSLFGSPHRLDPAERKAERKRRKRILEAQEGPQATEVSPGSQRCRRQCLLSLLPLSPRYLHRDQASAASARWSM